MDGKLVAEERNCFFEPHGFKLQGCVDAQGSEDAEAVCFSRNFSKHSEKNI